MHLHLGIDASGLPPGGAEEAHHLFVHDLFQKKIEDPQNVCILSIPTVFDPALAPGGRRRQRGDGGGGHAPSSAPSSSSSGKDCSASSATQFAVVHAYTAGNEPYGLWEGLDPRSKEYRDLKEERTQVLWVSGCQVFSPPPSSLLFSKEKEKAHLLSPPLPRTSFLPLLSHRTAWRESSRTPGSAP
jgi:hypothetical protein